MDIDKWIEFTNSDEQISNCHCHFLKDGGILPLCRERDCTECINGSIMGHSYEVLLKIAKNVWEINL